MIHFKMKPPVLILNLLLDLLLGSWLDARMFESLLIFALLCHEYLLFNLFLLF